MIEKNDIPVSETAGVRDLIEQYPLAWVSPLEGGGAASLLPLVGDFRCDGKLVKIIGHLGRSNPLASALKIHSKARILFTGPQGYVSPAHAGRRNWGPTWNYAQVEIIADVTVHPDLTPSAVDRLVAHMERDEATPWTAAELGERYFGLMSRIVGFHADIIELRSTFKLGQDETLDTLRSILSKNPSNELNQWTRRFNADRLDALSSSTSD